jgi:hypothetical protein
MGAVGKLKIEGRIMQNDGMASDEPTKFKSADESSGPQHTSVQKDGSGRPPVLRSVIDVPQTVIDEFNRQDREQGLREQKQIFWNRLGVFAVIAYGLIAFFQWRAMLNANLSTERALEIVQKPYVFIKSPEIDPLKIGQKITGRMHIINTGNLPALNFAMAGELDVLTECPKKVITVGIPPMENDIPPKIDPGPFYFFSKDPLSGENYADYKARTVTICFSGLMRYFDGFASQPILKPFCSEQRVGQPVRHCAWLNTQYNEHSQ